MLGLYLTSLGFSIVLVGMVVVPGEVAEPPGRRLLDALGSLRFWILFMAMFGAVGAPLILLALEPLMVLAVATSVAALGARALWPFFQGSVTADIGLRQFVGREARVVLPADASVRGKVVLETMAHRVELPALSADGRRLAIGDRVLVTFIRDGVASVLALRP